jgi:site-specific DNA-methyltransferase (adenine-specific)
LPDLSTETLQGNLVREPASQMEWFFDAQKRAESVSARPNPLKENASNLPLDQIICTDNLEAIESLPNGSINLIVTSPPYFQQRDYGYEYGAAGIGNEPSLQEYLDRLLCLFRECVRVTANDGSIVFNLGDKYQEGNLLLVPYRFAIAATETGLVKLVNAISWVKQNPTPRQFQRRLVSSVEPFFHFVKSDGYFYDINAFLSEPEATPKKANAVTPALGKKYFELLAHSDLTPEQKSLGRMALLKFIEEVKLGEIAGFRMKIRGIHAEAFGGQEGGRKIQMERQGFTVIRLMGNKMNRDVIETPVETIKGGKHPAIYPVRVVAEMLRLLTRPGDIVLDPFMGSGSTAVACKMLNRRYIGYDINPLYCTEAQSRVEAVRDEELSGLFEESI